RRGRDETGRGALGMGFERGGAPPFELPVPRRAGRNRALAAAPLHGCYRDDRTRHDRLRADSPDHNGIASADNCLPPATRKLRYSQSILTPAALITGPQRPISAAIQARNSAGELPT